MLELASLALLLSSGLTERDTVPYVFVPLLSAYYLLLQSVHYLLYLGRRQNNPVGEKRQEAKEEAKKENGPNSLHTLRNPTPVIPPEMHYRGPI